MADHKTKGVGIYCAIVDPSDHSFYAPFKITDTAVFSAFIEKARVGVNSVNPRSRGQYNVVYLAFGASGVAGQAGPLGLYVTSIDVTDPANPTISSASRIVQVGDFDKVLGETIQNLAIYDPINNNSQVAFWAGTASQQAILKRTLPGNCSACSVMCPIGNLHHNNDSVNIEPELGRNGNGP